jgi:hypothetical protein
MFPILVTLVFFVHNFYNTHDIPVGFTCIIFDGHRLIRKVPTVIALNVIKLYYWNNWMGGWVFSRFFLTGPNNRKGGWVIEVPISFCGHGMSDPPQQARVRYVCPCYKILKRG